MRVVSVPLLGSVTAKVCSRSSPAAIRGSQRSFCAFGAMPEQGAHGVELGVAGRAVRARAMDGLQHRCGRRERQAGAAIGLRNQQGQVPRLGQRLNEFSGIGALSIQLSPIGAGEAIAQPPHAFADVVVGFNLVAGHGQWDIGP